MTTTNSDPMQRLATACVDLLEGMIAARVDLGMTDPDDIAASLIASLDNLFTH